MGVLSGRDELGVHAPVFVFLVDEKRVYRPYTEMACHIRASVSREFPESRRISQAGEMVQWPLMAAPMHKLNTNDNNCFHMHLEPEQVDVSVSSLGLAT